MTAIIQTLMSDPRFVSGLEEFNAGNFFEAHEIWEELWNDLVGNPKVLCQGLIQIAAGYHKLAIGTPAGARKLFERGVRTLSPFLPSETAEMRELVAHVSRDLEQLSSGTATPTQDRPHFTL